MKTFLIFLLSALTVQAGFPFSFWKPTAGGGGGGGITLVNHLEYSPNGGSLTTGALNCTGANFIVIFIGTYKDWYATSVTDSNGNTYVARTRYAGGVQAGQYYYCFNPSGSLSALTFTVTGVSGNINLYSFFGILAFSGMGAGSYGNENGNAADTTAPLQPGSITPGGDGRLIVSGIFNYNAGGTPTVDSSMTGYGVAKSGNIGMGGHAWYVQPTAAAINPTWTSTSAAGSENAVVIASFAP